LPLARTVSRFDAGFAVPAWRDAGLTFAEATLDTLVPVEFTVTRIMLIPCPNRSRYSLLAGMVGCNIALEYPGRGPPRRQRIGETIASTLRLTGLTLLLNLLALPVYLLVPGINLFLFLLGREYFEVVALRRLDAAATRAARNRFGLRVFLGGVMIAALFSLPLVNLVAPVIATAFMVHVFEALPRIESHSPGPHPLTRSVV
jgi:CysZ protein